MAAQQSFRYQSDDYDRASQRFIIPLYVKDNLGNYSFSSTGTLVKYNDHHYIIFAAHALEKTTIENLFTFSIDGNFLSILSNSIGYKIFNESDIIIIDCFNARFTQKNYFNLNVQYLTGFDRKHFAWIGFPASKASAKKVHNSNSADGLKERYVISDNEETYFTNARYYTIVSKIKSHHNLEIVGEYIRKNASLKYQGDVSIGPHPQGMSGGAMYFFANNQELKSDLDATFRFAGIGIKYKKDNSIIGVSKPRIIKLLDELNTANQQHEYAATAEIPGQENITPSPNAAIN